MTYNELAELFKREGGDAQVCFSVISQNQILFGNNDTKKDIISFKNEEPIKWVKEVQEEPVSDECIYNRTLEERQRSCKFCSAACQVRIKEPVSEDLEKALAREWHGYNDRGAATVDALEDNTQELAFAKGFYRGAQWQKQQDQETIELAEDHAMLAGMEKMKEQMMAKAIDGDITFDYYGDGDKTYGCIAHDSFCLEDFGLKDRDKVKVIVIKEELNYE